MNRHNLITLIGIVIIVVIIVIILVVGSSIPKTEPTGLIPSIFNYIGGYK